MLNALIVALLMQALPPCELPDLDRRSRAWSSDFVVQQLADGAIGIAMPDPMAESDGRLPGLPSEAAPSLAHSQDSVWLWSEASDWLLVPASMEVVLASVGVDGSWIIEMHDPKQAGRRLRARGMGACVGCAYAAGARFFEDYATQARDNEFELCSGLARPIVRDDGSESRLRYHYDNARGLRHDAVAEIGIEEVAFSELVVSGLREELRDEILQAYRP